MTVEHPRRTVRADVGPPERLAHWQLGLPMARGHLARYVCADRCVRGSDAVADVACGIGYGASLLNAAAYHGYDRSSVAAEAQALYGWRSDRTFYGTDLDDPRWQPACDVDVTVCFETLEHLRDPQRVAQRLARWTSRVIVVSVPSIPTVGINPYHLHDIDVDELPGWFPNFEPVDRWDQVDEDAVVWTLHAR